MPGRGKHAFGGGLRVDPYTPQEFLTVAERVLIWRDPEMARVVAKAVLTELHSRDVRDAIRVVRLAGGLEEVPKVVETLRRRRQPPFFRVVDWYLWLAKGS